MDKFFFFFKFKSVLYVKHYGRCFPEHDPPVKCSILSQNRYLSKSVNLSGATFAPSGFKENRVYSKGICFNHYVNLLCKLSTVDSVFSCMTHLRTVLHRSRTRQPELLIISPQNGFNFSKLIKVARIPLQTHLFLTEVLI